MRWSPSAVMVVVVSCGLNERDDFLVGRQCNPRTEGACDSMQSCLPHEVDVDGVFDDYRCRNRASFLPLSDGREAPLAFCDPEQGLFCPSGLVCNADRIRVDAGLRRRVCTDADDPLAPPIDGGRG